MEAVIKNANFRNMAKNIGKKPQKKIVKSKPKKSVQKALVKESVIRPLGSRILIKPFLKEELQEKYSAKNTFGIILPEKDSEEKSETGKVMAVGPGSFVEGKFVPVSVKIGDIVAFSKYGYDEITVQGEELYLIKEEN